MHVKERTAVNMRVQGGVGNQVGAFTACSLRIDKVGKEITIQKKWAAGMSHVCAVPASSIRAMGSSFTFFKSEDKALGDLRNVIGLASLAAEACVVCRFLSKRLTCRLGW